MISEIKYDLVQELRVYRTKRVKVLLELKRSVLWPIGALSCLAKQAEALKRSLASSLRKHTNDFDPRYSKFTLSLSLILPPPCPSLFHLPPLTLFSTSKPDSTLRSISRQWNDTVSGLQLQPEITMPIIKKLFPENIPVIWESFRHMETGGTFLVSKLRNPLRRSLLPFRWLLSEYGVWSETIIGLFFSRSVLWS